MHLARLACHPDAPSPAMPRPNFRLIWSRVAISLSLPTTDGQNRSSRSSGLPEILKAAATYGLVVPALWARQRGCAIVVNEAETWDCAKLDAALQAASIDFGHLQEAATVFHALNVDQIEAPGIWHGSLPL